MRARITRALAGSMPAADPNAPVLRALAAAALAHGAQRGWRLAEEPQALRIQTIDAFNFWLASQLPVAARVGGALEVTEQPQALYQRAARATLSRGRPRSGAAAGRSAAVRAPGQPLDAARAAARPDAQPSAATGCVSWRARHPGVLCARVNEAWPPSVRRELAAACACITADAARAGAGAAGGRVTGCRQRRPRALGALVKLTRTGTGWRQQLGARYLGEAYRDAAARARLRDVIDDLAAPRGRRRRSLRSRPTGRGAGAGGCRRDSRRSRGCWRARRQSYTASSRRRGRWTTRT